MSCTQRISGGRRTGDTITSEKLLGYDADIKKSATLVHEMSYSLSITLKQKSTKSIHFVFPDKSQ